MATLTGKLSDVTSKTPENISSITVKAPSARIGGGTDVIVSSPATVDFNRDTGDITISGLTGGLSWLYIEGDGWSDSIPLAVADGMITLVEAIANAAGAPGLVDFIELLVGLQARVDDIAQGAVDAAAENIKWPKGVLPTNANLDEYTSHGYWGMPGTSTARQTILNTPGGTRNPGVLTVTRSGTTQPIIFHHFTEWTSDGAVLSTRMQVGGIWTGWESQKDWERGVIAGNTDLNNYKTPGVYVMHSSTAVRRTVANLPSPSAIGVLTVTSSAQVTFQEFVYWSSEGILVTRRQAVIDIWTDWTRDVTGGNAEFDPTQPIKVWGDSLVEGGDFNGSWAVGESLPERIGALVGTTVVNEGISGQTSTDILVRAGAIEMIGIPVGGVIPASGTVDVDMLGQQWDTRANRKSLPVYWAGVRGGLYLTSSGWTFTRSSSGDAVTVSEPTVFQSVNGRPGSEGTHIFIIGENDFAYGHAPEHDMASHIIANYERAIESVTASPHRHVLIGGIKTRAGQTYDDLQPRTARIVNDHLRRKYPLYYVDRMGWLLARGMEVLGLTPTTAEQTEISQGILPTRLFATGDDRHIRKEVLEAEARELWAPRLVRQGWAGVKPGVTLPAEIPATVADLRANVPPSLADAGSPEGKVAAPVGSIYTDTEATNGAIRWIKTSGAGTAGWAVEHGDTGWRDITGSLINGWTATAVHIRRRNHDVVLRYTGLTGASASSPRMMQLHAGFFTGRSRIAFTGDGSIFTAQVTSVGEMDMVTSFSVPANSYLSETAWTVMGDWPVTLPGTPV